MLKLDKNSWHVKLFHWCEKIWRRFKNDMSEWPSESTDLCTYMRTIFVWMPLAIGSNLAFAGFVGYTFVYYPYKAFGLERLAQGLMYVCFAIICACGLILTIFAFKYLSRFIRARRQVILSLLPTPPIEEPKPKKEKGPGFFDLIWQYIVEAHNQVCVVVKIEDNKESSHET